MNILEARQEIARTIRAYLQKDETGAYCFPALRQRPLMLMGPPGIGKTAIVEQIAESLHIGLVSYTMTHHTRQSAIGLPQIREQTFGGESRSVTRYTMSEIIAAVYDCMAQTGQTEGILFLDEINCVSDTLAPTMLQFLQNKTFGTHRLPEGWVIVAAGNPPEYNRSVRPFDVVTLDRIRTIDVEPDTDVFLQYGAQRGLHGAVLSWLRLNPQAFYHVSRREDQLFYVTARGWEDLSALLASYEALSLPVSEEVVSQFLRLPETARAFFAYYSLYRKYGKDYGIAQLLSGSLTEEDCESRCALAARGDPVERFAVTEMILQGMETACGSFAKTQQLCTALHAALQSFLQQEETLEGFITRRREALQTKQKFGILKQAELRQETAVLKKLDAILLEAKQQRSEAEPETVRTCFARETDRLTRQISQVHTALGNGIRFLRDSMGDGQELTALLTGMTASPTVMRFISANGCPEYLDVCDRLQIRTSEEALQSACREACCASE